MMLGLFMMGDNGHHVGLFMMRGKGYDGETVPDEGQWS